MIKETIIPYSLKKRIKKLPSNIGNKFYWCLDMLLKNENYPSLRNKEVEGVSNYGEFSITLNYRCVYRKEENRVFLLEIGKHENVF